MSSTICASLTDTAVPPLSRIVRRIRKSAMARGTRRPSATVCAFSQVPAASAPLLKARMIGAQPSVWTDTILGRRPEVSQPIASISANAFHMPIRPVPPPVG